MQETTATATPKRGFWRHAVVPTVVAFLLATLGQFLSATGGNFRPRVAGEYLGAELVHRASRTCAPGPDRASNCGKQLGDQVLAVTDSAGAATDTRYDPRGKLASRTDPIGNTTAYSYDSVGNLASETDAKGQTTRYGYDDLDRLLSVTDAIGGVTEYEYNAAGELTTLTDANGHAIAHTYWPTGRLKTNEYADGSVMSFGYDPNGNLAQRTKRDGSSISYTFDSRNRLRITTLESGRQVFTDYNASGLLTSVRDTETGQITYGHDLAQRVTTTTKANGAVIDYGHDPAGRVNSLTVGGRSQSWTYDGAGRTATATDFSGQTATLSYDTAGRLATLARPGAAGATAISYDDAGRITRVNSGPNLGDFEYASDAVGNRTAMTETLAGFSDTVDYQYDPLNRLIREARSSGTVNEFAYDAVGNRTRATGQPDREYDALDRVVGWEYDNNGNLLADDDATYAFDELDRLTSVSKPGHASSFTWDPEGNLLDQTQTGVTRSLVVDSQSGLARVLQERDPTDNAVTASYSYCSASCSKVTSVENSDGHRWTYADALGSIRTLGDDAGKVTDAKTYNAYGTEGPFGTGTNVNPYGFAGERTDGSGLQWLRARWYAPAQGTFLSRDSYAESIDLMGTRRPPWIHDRPPLLHPYSYVAGNPVDMTDPSGNAQTPRCFDENDNYMEYCKTELGVPPPPGYVERECVSGSATSYVCYYKKPADFDVTCSTYKEVIPRLWKVTSALLTIRRAIIVGIALRQYKLGEITARELTRAFIPSPVAWMLGI